jgi:hypothetical protein
MDASGSPACKKTTPPDLGLSVSDALGLADV